MPSSRPTAGAQDGFSLVEVLVASVILIVGLLGTFVLFDGANRTTEQNSARIGAANLAREVIEHARSLDYAFLTPSRIEAELRAKPGIEGNASGWIVRRRNVDYTVSARVCTFDDPKDGLAAAGQQPSDPCPTATSSSATKPDSNPDDFRRVDVTLTWNATYQDRTATQHTLIPNPSGSLGPRVRSVSEPTVQISTGDRVDFTATTDSAATLRWTADDTRSGGTLTGPATSWSFTWLLGDPATSTGVVDGRYTVTVQALNGLGSTGAAKFASVAINRSHPSTPPGFRGGRNERYAGTVDLRWNRAPERDILGYRLYRVSPSGRQQIFQTETATEFTDRSAPSGTLTYELVALDREDLKNPASAIRESITPAGVVVAAPGPVPATPTGLTATTVDGSGPRLQWSQPAGGNVIFFRIYRAADDQTGRKPTIDDRYAYTLTSDPAWTDPKPVAGLTTYWVSAVDESFNESPPSDPVLWSSV